MEQKRVSYKVAKAIKEAGYPQIITNIFFDKVYNEDGLIVGAYLCEGGPVAPTYFDVWIWLWREKIVELTFGYGPRMNDVDETLYCDTLKYHDKSHPNMKYIIQEMCYSTECCSKGYNHEHADPEEALINTIEFLVDNDMLRKSNFNKFDNNDDCNIL